MPISAKQIVELARKHANNGADMQSSAQLCLKDAETFLASTDRNQRCEIRENNLKIAAERALRSLHYSVGCFHEDYQRALFGGKN